MKKITFLFYAIFSVLAANAQKKQNTYFLKDNGKEVELKDSADYIRIIQEPDSGETNFVVQEFYTNGKRKAVGKASSFEPKLVYEGLYVGYHKNGKKQCSSFYEKGISVGKAFYFFEDGTLQKEIEYLPKDAVNSKSTELNLTPSFKLVYQADSLGEVFVQEGNGHLIDYSIVDKDSLIEEGNYKEGFKDGVWNGKYASGKSSYVETYNATKFVSGVTTVGDQTIEYTILEKAPEFKGGVNKFYKYLANTIRYPRDAAKNNVTGTVILSFTIEKDGTPTNIEVKRSVYKSVNEEAIRVIKSSPRWTPATQRGLPVRVKYNIPITFSLGR